MQISQEMEQAISSLNIELQKSKLEHKKEISKIKQEHEHLIKEFQKQLDGQKAQIMTLEEYQ